MYTERFGLKVMPFENVPDPVFFFDRGDYNRVLHRMIDSLAAGKGLMAIAGPIGAGKTTLSQKLMSDITDSTTLIWMAEPPEDAMELFLFFSQELGVKNPSSTRVFVIRDIREKLLEITGRGEKCLMVIDESHLMSDDVLEGIRLSNNLEAGAVKLVQIILLGQQEMIDMLSRPEMEAFRQRIAGLEVISKMEPQGVRQYILHRLKVAGGKPGIFSDHALEAVAVSTRGVPRLTNSLCDRALRVTHEENKSLVDTEEVHQAAIDLGLGRKTMHYILELKAGKAAAERTSPGTGKEEGTSPAAGGKEDAPVAGGRRGGKGLGMPLLFFVSSLAALAGSFWFYCSRAGSGDCAQTAIRTLF